MSVVISRSEALPAPAALERARGAVRVGIVRRAGISALADLYQQGSYKLRRTSGRARGAVEIALINTAGGATGGDRFSCDMCVEAGAHAVVTTPASEKIYRSTGGEALFETRLRVGARARLDWLPQETIVFNGGILRRRFTVDLAGTSEFLMAEGFVFGRRAMGEAVRRGAVRDRWDIRRDGRLVYAEALRLGPDIGSELALPTVLGEHVAAAGILFAGDRAEGLLDPLRCALDDLPGIFAGASRLDGLITARIAAKDGLALRKALVAAIGALAGRPVPRAWLC